MTPPRPPRGEISNRGRSSRQAAEKAWKQELGLAEHRGAKRLRERLEAVREEHHQVVDGIEYVEWSVIATVLDEVVRPLPDPTSRAADDARTAETETAGQEPRPGGQTAS
jgi:hypothetical protein